MNSKGGITRNIYIGGQSLEQVDKFKYLGAIVTNQGSKPEVLARISEDVAALTKLRPIWAGKTVTLKTKIRLLRSLVTSVFLYACESWTLTPDLERRIAAFEMRCYRKLLNISYKDRVRNETIREKITRVIGEHDDHIITIRRRKLKWFGHVVRSTGLTKTCMMGTVRGGRRVGRQRRRWEDNIMEWTGMQFEECLRSAESRSRWRELCWRCVVPLRPQGATG